MSDDNHVFLLSFSNNIVLLITNTYASISEINLVSKAHVVDILSDPLPLNAKLFSIAFTRMSRTSSPRYMPEIIFSYLKTRRKISLYLEQVFSIMFSAYHEMPKRIFNILIYLKRHDQGQNKCNFSLFFYLFCYLLCRFSV